MFAGAQVRSFDWNGRGTDGATGAQRRTQTFRRGQDEFGRNLLHELNSDVTRETQARNLQHNP